jgi:hypothetical protein
VISDTASAAGKVSAPRSLEEAEEIDRMARDRAREVVKGLPVARSSVVAIQGAPV